MSSGAEGALAGGSESGSITLDGMLTYFSAPQGERLPAGVWRIICGDLSQEIHINDSPATVNLTSVD
ncbi:MAG TPA: hypothetical protein VNN73_07265 [Blastocatellia bacterium]|nr:hypothetical protein [Blastocatellia bacterium]